MLAGSQHEPKSHLISQGPNKLQMYTVKAKLSTNQHREEVNSLCTCRQEKRNETKQLCRAGQQASFTKVVPKQQGQSSRCILHSFVMSGFLSRACVKEIYWASCGHMF